MPIEFVCPSCGAHLSLPEAPVGQTVQCYGCSVNVVVPTTLPSPWAAKAPKHSVKRHWSWQRRAVIGLVVLLVFSGAYAGYAWAARQPRWRFHTSAGIGFKVELPAPPRSDMAEIGGVAPTSIWVVEGTVLSALKEEYTVSYAAQIIPNSGPSFSGNQPRIRPYPIDPWHRLRLELAYLDKVPGIKRVIIGGSTTVNGMTAQDAELELNDGRIGLARAVDNRYRVFVLVACGPATDAGRARFRRFLDSFDGSTPAP